MEEKNSDDMKKKSQELSEDIESITENDADKSITENDADKSITENDADAGAGKEEPRFMTGDMVTTAADDAISEESYETIPEEISEEINEDGNSEE